MGKKIYYLTVINSHTSALRKVAALTAAEEAPLFSLSALHHMYGSTEPVASHPPDHEPTHLRSASVSNLLERGVAKFVEGLGVVAPDDLADFGESVLGLPREPRPRTSQGDTVAPSERSERH